MRPGIGMVGVFVHDQEEALKFYVEKIGFQLSARENNRAKRTTPLFDTVRIME